MTTDQIVKALEGEISRLQQVVRILRGGKAVGGSRRGTLSAAARKKIADAQRKRWAKVRAAKKSKKA